MALGIHFAIHRGRKEARIIWFDERTAGDPLPAGWESLKPRDILTDEQEFDRWMSLEPEDRLRRLCPPGFRIVR